MSSELSRLFRRAVLQTTNNEGVPAKLGKADGATLFYVDDAGTHHKDRVWARIGAGTAPAEAVVRCVSVPQTLNLPVIVADRDGVLTVIRTDTNRAVEWADGQLIDVAPHNWTHDRYGSDALYITGLSFLPLAAYPSDPPDLTVEVEQCFYRYQNTHKVFERTTSGSLSTYRPAGTTVTHYVILALDRSTNALAVIDGDDVSGGNRVLPSASTVLATPGIRSEHFPICAIRLYNAQTQIMPRDIFMDLRLWAGESSASGSGSSGSAAVRGPDTSTDHAIARWDGTDGTLLQDSYPTIDDSGNVDLQGNELRDYSHQMIEANTGAAYEIDWSAAGIFELTLTDDPTFTFVNESAGRAITLILIQDGTGSRTVTWPGAVEWPNDVEPILFSSAGDADTITLICRNDSSTVSGFAANDVRTNQGNTFTAGPQTIQVPTATQTGLILQTTDDDVTENLFEVHDSLDATLLGVAGANSSTFFQIFKANGTVVTTINTSNSRLQHNGFVKIGENAAPRKALDVTGQVLISDSGTNNVIKRALIAMKQYASAAETEGFTLLDGTGTSDNIVNFGGGNADANAASQISFYTAANTTTRTGTRRMFINKNGLTGIGANSTAAVAQLKVESILATTIGQIIKLAAAQTANAFEVQKSTGAIRAKIDSEGAMTLDPADTTLTTPALFADRIYKHLAGTAVAMDYVAYHNAAGPAVATMIGTRGGARLIAAQSLTNLYSIVAETTITAAGTVLRMSGVDSNLSVSNGQAATITHAYGFRVDEIAFQEATVTNVSGLYISSPTIDGGSIANAYGVNIQDINVADTLNYAIHTNLGDVRFGDEVVIASPTATALTIGTGTAGIDYTLTFDGETNDGVLTWKEDEAEWRYVDDVAIAADSKGLFLGAAQDMDIGYDGTDGYLRTDLVAPSDLNLDCGAAKTLELQAVVYEDLQVSINNLARGVTAPTDRFYDHGVGAGVAYPVLGFAKDDYVWFDVQTHHAMKLNTVLDNHIHFVLPNTTTIGHKFVFQLDVIVAGIDGTWAVPAGSPFTATHTVAANDDTTHRLLDIADIPASNTTVSSVYKCKLTRIDGVATEYASEVYLEFSDCHYQKNTMGSRQEGIK